MRAGSGSWSAWSPWQTGNTYTQSSNSHGVAYSFQVKTRCDNGSTAGDESSVGGPVSITYLAPLVAPATPSTSVTLSGGNVVATASTVSCVSGATTEYKIDLQINDGVWSNGSWTTSNTTSTANPQQGTKYDYRSTARCTRGSEIATSSTGAESPYVHPINAPAAPSISTNTDGSTTTFTRSDVAYPSGTTTRYQVKFQADWGYDSAWSGPTTGQKNTTWTTSSQGYEYKVLLQAHCYNSYATSGWSGTGTGSYIRPVDPPPAPWYQYQRPDARSVYIYGISSCGPGANLISAADIYTESWTFTPYPPYKYGWYRDNFGHWSQDWADRGTWVLTGTVSGSDIPGGKRFKGSFTMVCRNNTTGRQSDSNGYNESPLYST